MWYINKDYVSIKKILKFFVAAAFFFCELCQNLSDSHRDEEMEKNLRFFL